MDSHSKTSAIDKLIHTRTNSSFRVKNDGILQQSASPMGDHFFINSFIRSEGGMPNRNGGIRKNLFTSKLK